MRQRPRRIPRLLFLAIPALWFAGCVGPTTPLGAVDHPTRAHRTGPPDSVTPVAVNDPSPSRPEILFSPTHQQVHGPYTWQVTVLDPTMPMAADLSRVQVFYNDLEVTGSATSQFEIRGRPVDRRGHPALELSMPHLRLDPMVEHRIRVEYITPTGERLSAIYRFPVLENLETRETIATTAPFRVDNELRDIIEQASKEFGVNPALLTALIAQESSFNPEALSRSHALGLTQVTHGTEPDIARHFPGWPRNPSLGRFSRRALKDLIPGVINQHNEWRLDPEKSVRGGAFYLGYLRDRLLTDANRKYLENAGQDRKRIAAEAALAAYNSGLNRVLYMMKTHGPRWLDQRPTREAKRYVRRILSYYGAFRGEPVESAAPGEAT